MKKCPQCGFEPTPSNRQLLKLYEKEFGDLPVMAMIDRGWLGRDVDKADIPAIEKAILNFFEVPDEDALWELLSKPPQAIICRIEAK